MVISCLVLIRPLKSTTPLSENNRLHVFFGIMGAMKSLRDAIIDYDLVLLQGIATKRGLEPPARRDAESLALFCDSLVSPVSVAIALDDLSAQEREALNNLMAAGGLLEALKFSRLYGQIRAMGPNKLRRETPWQSPASPAEGLWYRGLIFKGFRHTVNGPEEVVFIPDDVQSLLPNQPAKVTSFQVSLASAPTITLPARQTLREDFFTLLVYIQMNRVKLNQDQEISESDQRGMLSQFSQTDFEDDATAHRWLLLVIHLARRMNMLLRQGQQLKLNSEPVRAWLEKESEAQLRQLQNTWRSDPTWNDLWHTTGLYPKDTGWENSPLLGRSKILSYLAQLPGGEWVSFNQFIKAIKTNEPDFQRPRGDYQSWYIYDKAGKPLMGFEHWEAVEGRLIRYILGTILFALGALELGAPARTLAPTAFRITPLGERFLDPDTPSKAPPAKNPPPLRINAANFIVRVPNEASLFDRFQLARFAALQRREELRAIYQISRQSYLAALEQHITPEQIQAFLSRATRDQVPLALVEAMHNWSRRRDSVKLESLTLLRVSDPDMVSELLNHREIGPLLDQPFGKRGILVPEQHVDQVRGLLVQYGYLDAEG